MSIVINAFEKVNPWYWVRKLAGQDIGIFPCSGVPVNGVIGTGTGAGFLGKGALIVDVTTGLYYANTGTKASPVWTGLGGAVGTTLADGKLLVGNSGNVATARTISGDVTFNDLGVSAVGAGKILEAMLGAASLTGLGALRFAKATYDFAVDGGAIGLVTFALNATIPINAIILGGIIDVITPFTTGTSGTMSIGTSAGSSVSSVKGALAAASYTGLVAVVPVFSAATMFKMSAAGTLTGTIATGTITAGKANIILAYVVGG